MSVKSSMVIHAFNPSPQIAIAVGLLWFKATLSDTRRTRPVTAIYMAWKEGRGKGKREV